MTISRADQKTKWRHRLLASDGVGRRYVLRRQIGRRACWIRSTRGACPADYESILLLGEECIDLWQGRGDAPQVANRVRE